ncbi:imidazolonepropionase [Agromyces atrinae]|uniref:Imidazolonepropionase n=1 Tax=Agromyces atrinae TaxID=592376 RepID=A0A852SLQ7_9MICO|nr:imidazolonepropionase [Agromyces atrinae]NYD68287.1 imidazolonepropionase [Agromyces atrinae]
MTRTLLTNIGELVTNDRAPGRERGALGVIRSAAVLVEDGRIAWVGSSAELPADLLAAATAPTRPHVADSGGSGGLDTHQKWQHTGGGAGSGGGAATDDSSEAITVVDAAGRAVLPGFVDSHTHLVFAGDRSAEFEARMAGRRYEAGGIRSTVAATRAASDDELRARLAGFVDELLAQGTTTFEVKSGYGLTVADEERAVRLAREVTPEVTFLGAHVVPAEYAEDPDAYVDLVVGPMLEACAPHARWIDVFCETGAFTPEQSRRVLEAGAARGLGVRVHGNQLGPGGGVRLAVALDAASVDHCTHLDDADVAALAGSSTVATLLPGVEFSTREPYPDARRLLDAGVTVALASDCNPGSSFTSSLPLCIAVAVRDMGMTVDEAVWAATAGGAAALRRTDVGVIRPGARADLVLLDAPSVTHLAYRPGVPLIAGVWKDGTRRA